MKSIFLVIFSFCFLSCRSNTPVTTQPEHTVQTDKHVQEKPKEAPTNLVIEGDLGTIDEALVQRKFNESREQVNACIHHGIENSDYVGGTLYFTFRIAMDGTVKNLDMKSTVGHREIEACMYAFAKQLQFPKPEGGEAQVNFTWSFDPATDVGHVWDASKLGSAYTKMRSKLIRCSDGSQEAPSEFQVIFYVLPDAELGPVGVSSGKSLVSDKFYKCVTAAIKSAKLPDPLGNVARVTIDIAP